MNLEQTYTLRQAYLENIKYKSQLNAINEKTAFKQIEKYIDQELSKPVQTKSHPDINSLHEQIDSIVYLSRLSSYYVDKVNFLDFFSRKKIIARLKKIGELAEKRQMLLSNELQAFIKNLSEEDKAAETLINHELNYLKTFYSSNLSTEAEEANQSYLKIDIQKIKNQSKEDYIKLKRLFESYKLRCSKEKEKTNMSGFTEEEENKSDDNDSGHCSDDASSTRSSKEKGKTNMPGFTEGEENKSADNDSSHCLDDASSIRSSISSYRSAVSHQSEQTIPTRSTAHIEVPKKQPNKPTAHPEKQKQNPPHKESLSAQIWGLLKKIWQKIKNIFKSFEKNHELENMSVTFSKSEQSITFNTIKEIPAVKNKKGYTTLYLHKADSRQNQSPEQEEKRVVGYIRR